MTHYRKSNICNECSGTGVVTEVRMDRYGMRYEEETDCGCSNQDYDEEEENAGKIWSEGGDDE